MLDDEKLVELLVRRDDLLEQGDEATPEEVCEGCPELVDEYKARLESLKRTDWLFETEDGEDDDSLTSPVSATASFVEAELPSSSLTIDQFMCAITNSGLMTAEEVQTFQQIGSADVSSDTQSLARELVQRKKLTLYQASVLLSERSDPLLLDRYVILDTIDAGGMGVVFKALHRSLDRVVALKTLPPSAVDSEEKVKRFQREARTAAKLSHPNIVTTHDAHESNGVHFLIMEYVKGEDLRKLVKAKGPLPVATAVDYMLQAARGLEHAHAQGVVHRDIKPGNLLLDADGTVKVLDLGLARLEASNGGVAETEEDLTAVGGVMGTAAYMSPEQGANTHDADARSDVYSLGCTLYYLLTGKPPYREETYVSTILAHREKPIPPLSEGRDDVPEDVIAVYRRMMAKKPEDRFQSMTEVIEALSQCEVANEEAVAAGELPNVIEETIAYSPKPQSQKWLWTLGAVAMLITAVIVLGIIFKIKTPVGTLVVEVNEPDAEVEIDGGKVKITTPSDRQPVEIEVDEGRHTLKVSKGGFETHTKEITIKSGDKEVVAVRLVPMAQSIEPPKTQGQPPEQAKRSSMSNATRTNDGVDPPAAIPMVRGFRLGRDWEPQVKGVELLNDKMSAIALTHTHVQRVNLDSGEVTTLFARGQGLKAFTTMALSPDKRFAAVGTFDGDLLMCDLENRLLMWEVQAHQDSLGAIAFSPNGKQVVTGSHDKYARIWDTTTGERLSESSLGERQCYVAAFMPDNTGIVLGGSGGWLELRDVESNVRLRNFTPAFKAGNTRAGPLFVNDGRQMLSGHVDTKADILLWDVPSGEVSKIYRGHATEVGSLRLLSDGHHFISGSTDGTLRIWSLDHDQELYRGEDPTARTRFVAVTSDGKFAVTGGLTPETATESLFLWELPDLAGDVKDADQEPSATQPEPGGTQPPPPAIAPFNATEARDHQQAWADHLGVPVEFENSIGMKMVLVPPGEFMMGSSEEEIAELLRLYEENGRVGNYWTLRIRCQGPQHRVRITGPFYIAVHEVTIGHFKAFVEATGYEAQAESDGVGGRLVQEEGTPQGPEFTWRTPGFDQTDEYPVCQVSWDDATSFCEWMTDQEKKTYQLPTEAQWEYACRAGSTARWFFGGEEKEFRRYAWTAIQEPLPVGQKWPNGFRLFDTLGNVAEWCSDWYYDAYYGSSPMVDPKGPSSGTERVGRGGSYYGVPLGTTCSIRLWYPQTTAWSNIGFRPVLLIESAVPKPTLKAPTNEAHPQPDEPSASSSAESGIEVNQPDAEAEVVGGITMSEKTQARIEREVADWVLSRGGWIEVQTADSAVFRVHKEEELPSPDVSFSVVHVDLTSVQALRKPDIDRLLKLRNLNKLGLNHTHLPESAVESLTRIKGLDDLGVCSTPLSNEAFRLLLANNPDLRILNVISTGITEERIAEVVKLKQLETLWIDNLTDEGLRILASHENLEKLSGSASSVTDTGIAHLENMKNLRRLALVDTSVTAKGVEKLQTALPDCEIVSGSDNSQVDQ